MLKSDTTSAAAPAPTEAAADVVSLFSNVYPDVPVGDWSTTWDSADVVDILVAGDDVTTAIREPEISMGASAVSARPVVRAGLLELQRRLAGQGGAVLEGRDIGTVVCPDAESGERLGEVVAAGERIVAARVRPFASASVLTARQGAVRSR